MQFKKRFGVFIGAFLAVVLAVASCSLLFRTTTQPAEAEPRMTVAEKKAELEAAEGQCDEYSIVLQDTNEETVLALAEKLGATYRMTEDKTFATLQLPSDTTIFDVYDDADYEAFLTEFTPDYYAHIAAEDALGNALIATRPNYEVFDEYYAQQTYLDYLNLSDTWATTKGQGVTVAIIDTGIDTDHPEFEGRISEYSYNASEGKVVLDYGLDVIEDEQGHGTKVAGVLAAGMDGSGVTGIAPEAEILVIKCECDEYGQFLRSSDLVFGLAYAIERDVDVVNMSFGTIQNLFSKYTQLAVDSDIICVAAAGNDGSSLPSYPAADPNVIGVGAVDQETWGLASYSNYGDNSEVLAPGTTFTTDLEGGYMYGSGTSLSSPIVAGAVALYLSQNPYSEYTTVEGMLQASSIDIGPLGEDWENGFGLLDIYSLVCAEKGTLTYEMLTDEVSNQTQYFVRGRTIQRVLEPERENVVLDGWYYDAEATDEYAYFEDVFTQDLTLYASWINEDEGSAYVYTALPNGTIELQKYLGKRRFITVPAELEGKPVTSIGEFAFANNSRIRSITLPETLTNIGQYAFSNVTYLRSIDIPETVTNIANNAFEGCASLTQVNIRQNSQLASIGNNAFAMCGIQSFTIPSKLTYLGDDAFYASAVLSSVEVMDGNANFCIRDNALYNASGNTLIYYPAGLVGSFSAPSGTIAIGPHAFAYSKATEIVLSEGIKILAEGAFISSSVRSLAIPSSVEVLGEYLCAYCYDLGEVTLSSGVYSSIPKGCFNCCNSLKSILIPNQILLIDKDAFASSGVASVSFADDSNLVEIDEDVFWATPLTSIVIPASVQKIKVEAFNYCTSLSSVVFEDGSNCWLIENNAFAGCTSLKQIELPDSLTNLGMLAFYGSGLESVTVGASLTELGAGCFSGCEALSSINVVPDNPEYSSFDGVVYNKTQTELCLVPGARSGTYTLPETVKTIAGYAFAGAKKISEVILNEGLEVIGDHAFYGCIGLTRQNMPNTLLIIGSYAFNECSNLRSVTLPDSLQTIEAGAFSLCTSLSGSITIPKQVISIGYYAFYGDYSLTSITIAPESELSRLDYGVFAYCGITDFTVPASVNTMGQEIFTGCRNLVAVTFEGDNQLTNLAAWTFHGADELRQITFEEGSHLTIIEARACEGLPKLERISLEYCTELATIDNYAFNGCVSLSAISLPDSLVSIGRYAFSRCYALTELRLPLAIDYIGRYAFAGDTSLNVYFRSATLPAHLQDNWDYDIAGYYTGISGIHTSGDWTYALSDDGKASIVAYLGSDANISLSTIDGHQVVSIGSSAFEGNTTLRSISLPDTLTGIYNSAFKNTTSLENVVIPASVTVIDNEAFRGSGISSVSFTLGSALQALGRYAFADTANLASVTIPARVEKIRDYTFFNSGIKNITFAEDSVLSEVGRYAFSQSGLTSITLPSSLTKIDHYAFSEATKLTSVDFGVPENLMIFGNAFYKSGLYSVNVPAGVTYLGEFCFTNCQQLTDIDVSSANATYSSVGGVLFNKAGSKLITCPAGKTGSYEIPKTVCTMAFAAFEGGRINEVVIPEDSQLITIGYRAFFDCDGLTAINIPPSVLSIDNYAFAYCDNLETVDTGVGSQLSGIYKGAFYNDAKLGAFLISGGIQEISDYAFYGCSSMGDVQLSETSGLKMISNHAFEQSGVTTLVMPAGLQEIGDYAFRGAKLSTLVFNDAILSVGDFAFADCGLENTPVLRIPESVSYLGLGALRGADGVVDLTVPFVGQFLGDMGHVFADLYGGYANGVEKITILNGTEICAYAFCDTSNDSFQDLEYVVLPDNLVELGRDAFHGVDNLKTITIPTNVKVLREMTFWDSGVERVVLPEGLEVIEAQCFEYASKLVEINLPAGLKKVGERAFRLCSSLLSITIPKGVEEITPNAFSGCENMIAINVETGNDHYSAVDGILYNIDMTSIISVPGQLSGTIHIPEGITRIDDYLFDSCVNISGVELPSTLSFIGRQAFSGCNSLKNVVIPESVTEVGNQVFWYCTGLETLTIEGPIEDLLGMCDGCKNLKKLNLPEGLKRIGPLENCTHLEELIIPDSVTEFPNIRGCSGLSYIFVGASVEEVYYGSYFEGLNSLERIDVSESNEHYASFNGMLFTSDLKELLIAPRNVSGNLVLPDGLESINAGALAECNQLTSITLPSSLKEIGYRAFVDCKQLVSITIPESVESIGGQILEGTAYAANPKNWYQDVLYVGDCAVGSRENDSQEALFIKNGTRLITDFLCIDNDSFWYLYLPDSVRIIGNNAFLHCRNLRAVRMSGCIERMGYNIFEGDAIRSFVLPDTLDSMSINPFIYNPVQYIYSESITSVTSLQALYTGNDYLKYSVLPICSIGVYDEGISSDTLVLLDGDSAIYADVKQEEFDISDFAGNREVIYKDNWNLVTFFMNGVLIDMEPLPTGGVVQAPADSLIAEYLLPGQTFVGWDINGDGKADSLPATLTDDLEAVAILTTPISGISMQEEATIELGDTLKLDATCEPVYNDGNEALVWSTSDASVALVDGNGLVTPVAEGVATITASLVDNPEIAATCEVTVIPRQPGIHLAETSGTLVKGETMTLTPEVIQPEGVDEPVVWTSTDEDVATVEDGLITAVSGGKADILITCGEYEATFKLTVTSPMVGMSVANPVDSLNAGETHAIDLAFDPEDTTDSKSATYTSSDTSVATVSRSGVVTALKPGMTTITVTVGEFTDSFELEVFAPIKWIKLNTTTGTMRIERTKQLEVIYEPSNTTDDRTATFVSSDPEVATVTKDGLVTAISAGTATITCTVGEHEATYTVTVVGLKNAETGIIVTNSDDSQMNDATELEIVNVSAETPEAAEELTEGLENEIGEVTTTTVLDISLTEGGETVQPDTTVDVEIPVAGDLTHDTVLVYRAEEDGSFTDMTAEKGDDYLTFTTEHFSVYMVSVVHEFTNYVYNNDAHGATDGTETAVCDHPGCTVTHTRTAVGTGCKLAAVAEVPATCTEAGTAAHYRCEDCGKLYVFEGGEYVEKTMNELVIPATGHDWDEGVVTTAPTCEKDGVLTYTCAVCGETRTESIPATGHTYVSVAEVPATCTEAGTAAHFKCANCGKLFILVDGAYVETAASDLVIPALGHDWDDGVVTTQPTCETDGTITYTCKHDASHTRTDTIPATGHSWDQGTVTKPATTSEEGIITYTCTVCGETRTEAIPKLEPEHEPGWAKEDGGWYYYEDDGTPRTEQWIQIGKSWGYLGVDGRLIEAGWAPAGNTWYYIKKYTVMKEGWASYGGNWYYIKNYSVMKEGWVVTSGKYYYIRSYTPVTNDWVRYNGTWYHFNASGVCDRVA